VTAPSLVTVLHVGPDGCGLTAFRLTRRPHSGDRVDPSTAVLLDGRHPKQGDPMICGTCGLPMFVTDAQVVGGFA
jgi:hypothetical protein